VVRAFDEFFERGAGVCGESLLEDLGEYGYVGGGCGVRVKIGETMMGLWDGSEVCRLEWGGFCLDGIRDEGYEGKTRSSGKV
jgi:hypothetical protein